MSGRRAIDQPFLYDMKDAKVNSIIVGVILMILVTMMMTSAYEGSWLPVDGAACSGLTHDFPMI